MSDAGEVNRQPFPQESPIIEMQLEGLDTFRMTWQNTFIRRFYEGDGEYDHVIHRVGEQAYAFKVSPAMEADLENRFYPIRVEPLIDMATREWYVVTQMRSLDADLQPPE